MIKAHKIRLNPTPEQANYFARAAGTARFVWNWALAEWNRQYEAGEKPTALKLKKRFNEIRREPFPWTWEVTKNASDQPFLDLGKAYTAFFEGLKNGKKRGRPKFKSKKRSRASFYLANDQFELGEHGGEPSLQREGNRGTDHQNRRLVVCKHYRRTGRRATRSTAPTSSRCRHRCGPQPTGNLEHRRGIREPSIPQNGAGQAASGQQTPPSTSQRIKEP